jgi:acyl-CoA synthetase (AMP-forming)/AMP-acid ligase II
VLLGAFKARAVIVGVNWRLAPPEVAYVLNDAACEILFVGKDFTPRSKRPDRLSQAQGRDRDGRRP